jgi:hypothetical protein
MLAINRGVDDSLKSGVYFVSISRVWHALELDSSNTSNSQLTLVEQCNLIPTQFKDSSFL